MKRIICVWLPNWPVTRAMLSNPALPPDKPLAIVAVDGNRRRLMAVNEAGLKGGLLIGQPVTDAKAIIPDLLTLDAGPEGDRAALEALAEWAQRFSPSTAVEGQGGLWLDITGCAQLWGGEERLLENLTGRLARRGIPCLAAIADSYGAAWALARHAVGPQKPYCIAPPGAHREMLADLPPASLRLPSETLDGLRRLGLATIRQILALPRGDLAGRFGDLLTRLDQAFGDAGEAIAFRHPPSPWFEPMAFADFIMTPEDLARALDALAAKLCRRLSEAGQGGRMFEACFYGADASVQRIAIATSMANCDARSIARLLTPKLEGIDPGFGIEAITLRAGRVEALKETQLEMDRGAGAPDLALLAPLIDKLGNRIGFENIWRAAVRESHVPERSVRRVPPLEPPTHAAWRQDQSRPIRLLARPELIEATALIPDDPPVRFRWRGILRRVVRAGGPERIASEWWRDPPAAGGAAHTRIRDYYRVEDASGARFWVYRAGHYADAEPPRWYLHGFFA